jgi:hypothetical protein
MAHLKYSFRLFTLTCQFPTRKCGICESGEGTLVGSCHEGAKISAGDEPAAENKGSAGLRVASADRDAAARYRRRIGIAETSCLAAELGRDDQAADVQAFARYRHEQQAQITALLFPVTGPDLAASLSDLLDDLDGVFSPNDGGICLRTIEFAVAQLERVRLVLR